MELELQPPGAQIGSGREGGGGHAVGVSVKVKAVSTQILSNEPATGKELQERSSFLSAIHAYQTCLIKESP